MATLNCGASKSPASHYRNHRLDLDTLFFKKICAYCWTVDKAETIDHYKPKQHFPKLKNEFNNLLLVCATCNSKKGDYHPSAKKRKTYKDETHYIFNCREHDIGEFIKVSNDGKISSKKNLRKARERVAFFIRVFDLEEKETKRTRGEYIKILNAAKEAMQLLKNEVRCKNKARLERILDTHIELIATRFLFFYFLNLKIPRALKKRIEKKRRELLCEQGLNPVISKLI